MRLELAGTGTDGPRSVSGRIAAIIMEVASGPGLTLTDIARRTRLPVSTTHRLLGELVDGRVLERGSGTYTVCRDLGGQIASPERAADTRSQVNIVLEDLWTATRSRARFGVWTERGVSYLERPAGGRSGRCWSGLAVLPLHAAAMGKALLAHAPPAIVAEAVERGLPSYTPHTITTARQLHQALAVTRRLGVAVSRWELRQDECAIAVPVFGPRAMAVGALELAVDNLAAALREAHPPLVVAARGLSRRLALDPAALPTGFGSAPLRWRADPTSPALSWTEPEVAG